jgi:phosphate uptake regulator
MPMLIDLSPLRIGDYSVPVANVALAPANKPITGLELHVARMAEIADGILRRSMEAYAAESDAGLEKVFEDGPRHRPVVH